jgi:hypothetical protein
MRRKFVWISALAASLVAVGVIVQLYLVASWIFGAGSAVDAHRANGIVVWALGIAVGISGVVAYWRVWRKVGVSIALPVLTEIQIVVVGSIDHPSENVSGWIHGFHGGLAIFVFLLAAWIAYRDFTALRGGIRLRPAGP